MSISSSPSVPSKLAFPFEAGDPLLHSNAPTDIAERNKILDGWLGRIVSQHGLDNGSELYALKIHVCARRIVRVAPPHIAVHMLNELSEICESQLPLAENIERLTPVSKGLDSLDYNLENLSIGAVFSYLKQPVTEDTIRDFLGAHTSLPKSAEKARHFHEHFWLLSDEDREAILSRIVDVKQRPMRFRLHMSNQAQPLIDDFLPPEKTGSKAKDYGLAFIQTMAMATTNKELLSLFSHALSAVYQDARAPRSEDPDIRFGYRLTQFLVSIGGAKLAQGTHSYSQTLEPWKIGLSESKSEAAPLRRVDFLRQAQNIEEPWRSAIKRIGRRRGTGTYIDTKCVEFTDEFLSSRPDLAAQKGEDGFVIQLLKNGSAERSKHVFDLAIGTIQRIAQSDSAAAQSIGGLIPVIEHKAAMIKEETDLRLAATKAEIAEKLVSGVKVIRPRLTTVFFAAGVFGHGQNFRISRNVLGLHFNQLPERTSEELRVKQEAAEAIFTTVLFTILTGKPFDSDRHGDNNGISCYYDEGGRLVIRVGDFDDGAIIIDPPTDTQKQLFANIVMDAIANSAINGFNPISSLKHIFTEAQKTPELSVAKHADDLFYVDAMIEAIVSLGDYTKYMGKRAMLRSLRAVFNAHHIDPVISSTFGQRFDSIRELRRGSPSQSEAARRQSFYPPPTNETERFTSRANRGLGKLILNLGPKVLGLKAINCIAGSSAIDLPEGYQSRFSDHAL